MSTVPDLYLCPFPRNFYYPHSFHSSLYSSHHAALQIDVTYGIIKALQTVGLATNVKLPSEKQKERLRIKKPRRRTPRFLLED